MTEVIIHVPRITQRLNYIFDIVLVRLLGLKYRLLTDAAKLDETMNPVMVYGEHPIGNYLFFRSSDLLFSREIHMQNLQPFMLDGLKAIFPVFHERSALPFDPFAAAFYLVSRFEEYLPFAADGHGRFEAGSSVMHQWGMLDKPLVNLWANMLGKILEARFPGLVTKRPEYKFTPTYDIDVAWAYLHKGFYRSIFSAVSDLTKADLPNFRQRIKVLQGLEKDDYDTYDYQLELQERYNLQPVYFFLFAEYGRYDKNNPVANRHFGALLRRLADYAQAGIHPSYNTFNDKARLQSEINGLSQVLRQPIKLSRQHYLRLRLPLTYHNLIDLDITDDYTMGFASAPGFRAGITIPFPFYDLDHDVTTTLHVHPFMIMDGSLRDYLNLDPEAAIEKALPIIASVKENGGELITLWHNESLSDKKRWTGWRTVYEKIIEAAV
ncbi:MAG TPA: polysaccharide deacetylase family protein [Bacteroidales bacterium]|nr:polysaccharide deacetylase family protein [Bacteroidales bacterium]